MGLIHTKFSQLFGWSQSTPNRWYVVLQHSTSPFSIHSLMSLERMLVKYCVLRYFMPCNFIRGVEKCSLLHRQSSAMKTFFLTSRTLYKVSNFSLLRKHKTFRLPSLSLVFLFHLISLGNPISSPLQSMHLRNLAFFLEPVVISHLLNH